MSPALQKRSTSSCLEPEAVRFPTASGLYRSAGVQGLRLQTSLNCPGALSVITGSCQRNAGVSESERWRCDERRQHRSEVWAPEPEKPMASRN